MRLAWRRAIDAGHGRGEAADRAVGDARGLDRDGARRGQQHLGRPAQRERLEPLGQEQEQQGRVVDGAAPHAPTLNGDCPRLRGAGRG